MVWNPAFKAIYFGCQNTSIQWLSFDSFLTRHPDEKSISGLPVCTPSLESLLLENGSSSGTSTPRRVHKFFDSYPQYERKPADLYARNPIFTPSSPPSPSPGLSTPPGSSDDPCLLSQNIPHTVRVLQVPAENMIWSAHYGYVYCMALVPSSYEGSDDLVLNSCDAQLVTGSGDSTVKVCTHSIVFFHQSYNVLLGLVSCFCHTRSPPHFRLRARCRFVHCSAW